MKKIAVRLLKESNLNITSQRLWILSIFLADPSKAFSSSELLQALTSEMNSSTVYRSLNTLIDKKLLYKMVDMNGDTIYTLNLEKKCVHSPHPHLKCSQCGTLECLPALPVDYVNLLYKSGVDQLNIVLGGICSNCS